MWTVGHVANDQCITLQEHKTEEGLILNYTFNKNVCVNGLQARDYMVCKPDCFLPPILHTDVMMSVNKWSKGAAAMA